MAGNICNTKVWEAGDAAKQKAVRASFKEQIGWAVGAGADVLLAGTIDWPGDAECALQVMAATGLPARGPVLRR